MSKSKIGNDIRQYFIDLEIAFYKFKNYIIEGMNNKIKQLENNQKPKINSSKGLMAQEKVKFYFTFFAIRGDESRTFSTSNICF
jgi:hypothetical protein